MSLYLGTSPVANTGYNKANTDLSNLTSTGKNIANWSSNVTNCITYIPQDIKLELNNGTLTLKAGSKVYKAGGESVIVSSDINYYFNGASLDKLITIYDTTANGMGVYIQGANAVSSSTAPSTGVRDTIWFDTTNNVLKVTHDNASTWTEIPLPIALVSCTTTDGFTSIDQVFNGFGYIGSTVFALPGIKGLIPNGRNADGTLKNIEFEISSVLTMTTGAINITMVGQLFPTGLGEVWKLCYTEGNKEPSNTIGWNVWYNTNDNISYLKDTSSSSSVWTPQYGCNGCFKFTTDLNSKITSFTTKTAFHAVDYNDSSTISGWSMPSSRYIDLTLGASGATYTAPANGWFTLGGAGGWFSMYDPATGLTLMQIPKDNLAYSRGFLPAREGAVIAIDYSGLTVQTFRFIYAQGEN